MPYISPADRPNYDALIAVFLQNMPSDDLEHHAAMLILSVAERIYGSADQTRYYLQNEFLGVLYAASLEYRRRTADCVVVGRMFSHWSEAIPEVSSFADKLHELVPSDPTKRPGHLNYLITEFALALVARKWLDRIDGPCDFFGALAYTWYHYTTGPYEDAAIENNGDTPGYLGMDDLEQ
jgi:hypothetical protein